jgi:hypothetical protein
MGHFGIAHIRLMVWVFGDELVRSHSTNLFEHVLGEKELDRLLKRLKHVQEKSLGNPAGMEVTSTGPERGRHSRGNLAIIQGPTE